MVSVEYTIVKCTRLTATRAQRFPIAEDVPRRRQFGYGQRTQMPGEAIRELAALSANGRYIKTAQPGAN